jgi:hypothetical protein
MVAKIADYEVKCMLCGTEVGRVVSGRFKQHDGCGAPMPHKGGLRRCCHCGGSLYFDRIGPHASLLDRAQITKLFANEVA